MNTSTYILYIPSTHTYKHIYIYRCISVSTYCYIFTYKKFTSFSVIL